MIFIISFHRFGLSEKGTHAGVIVFSDFGRYSNLEIKFDKYYNLKPFLEHVERLPFYGYRTRIDLAFEIADKQLFSKAGGTFIYINLGDIIFLKRKDCRPKRRLISLKWRMISLKERISFSLERRIIHSFIDIIFLSGKIILSFKEIIYPFKNIILLLEKLFFHLKKSFLFLEKPFFLSKKRECFY